MSETCASKIIAGEAAVLARRYATALFKLAEEKNQMDAVVADVRLLRHLLDTNPDFARLVRGARMTPAEQGGLVQKTIEAGKLSVVMGQFLQLLCRKHRLGSLCPILNIFKADIAKKRGEYTAEVISACALSAAQVQTLSTEMGRKLNGHVEIVVKQDASLLGGLTVKLGSHFVDASIKGKLAQLEKKLKSQQEAA